MERETKTVTYVFFWLGKNQTVSGSPEAIAALKDLVATFKQLQGAAING